MSAPSDHVLEIDDLTVSFHMADRYVPVVEEVSLAVPRGRFVALVGESGCGKSLTALSVLGLVPEPPARVEAGALLFRPEREGSFPSDAIDLRRLNERAMRGVRGAGIAMVFQEPLTSLNPVMTAGEQIREAVRLHTSAGRRVADATVLDLLADVGIPDPVRCASAYPHELSGGMRQRVMIAMALACEPELLIADEPTTALDVTVQAQLLELLRSLKQRRSLSVLLITHDLGVVARVADEVYVMYSGRIVEHAEAGALFAQPTHPYTEGLLACTPRVSRPRARRMPVIPGTVPRPADRPSGCAFHPRCPLSRELAEAPGADSVHADGVDLDRAGGPRVLRACAEADEAPDRGRPALRALRDRHEVACHQISP